MTLTVQARLRKLLIAIAALAALLGWAAVAAADRPARADSGEPRTDKAPPLDEDSPLLLPDKWDDPSLLLQAAIELNSRLAQAERSRLIVPWKLADEIRASLLAGRMLAEKIDEKNRPAYYQALFFSALAAGYPADALAASRELLLLDSKLGWNWLSQYRAGMLCGDKAVCDEAIREIQKAVAGAKGEAFAGMKRDAAIIGQSLDCPLALSDGTTVNPARCADMVLVIDVFAFSLPVSRAAMPHVRSAFNTFKGYPAFRMIGLNMDKRENKPQVLAYLKGQNADWPVFFEPGGGPPVSAKLLSAWAETGGVSMPTEIVVGPSGKVIYSGLPDSVFHYAIRAGLVQANKGRIPASQPDGQSAAKPPTDSRKPPMPGPPPSPDDARKLKAERDKQANQKMKIAEAFTAAGSVENAIRVYKEVLLNYPDTDAAVLAKKKLLMLEGEK